MSEWRPIEEAPKDGTPVLSWDGFQCAIVIWGTTEKSWLLCEGHNEPHEDCPIEWEATHFMPLPEPPR